MTGYVSQLGGGRFLERAVSLTSDRQRDGYTSSGVGVSPAGVSPGRASQQWA